MKKIRQVFAVMTGILLFCMTADAFSQDWSQWRGANRDGKVTNFKAPDSWPSELKQSWKISVGLGDASPVMSGNLIYTFGRIGTDEVIKCLDAATGKEIWESKYPALAISGPASSQHPGPRSTPVVGEGKIVTLGIGGVLSCLDAKSGKLIWRNEAYTADLPQFFTGLSPLINNGVCYVHLGGKEKGRIIAFELKTGKTKWEYSGEGPSYASLALLTIDGKKQLVDLTEKSLIGIDTENGNLLWQYPLAPANRFYNAASPVTDGQTIYITGQGQGTRAIKIQKKGNGFEVQELWKNAELGTKWNTPVLKDGFLYGLSDQRKLYCMNAGTGETVWMDTRMLNDFGEIVDAGSLLFALPQTSDLIIYKPDSKAYTEVAVVKVAETPTYTYPILTGNKIFIKDKESVTMLTVK